MTKKIYFILLLFLGLFACKNNKQSARQPVNHQVNHVDMRSVNYNKDLNKREELYIKKMIKNDSLHQYINSGHGFWYYYIKKNPTTDKFPQTHDWVTLNYELRDLSNNIIYSSKEIGKKKYHVDHENYFRGFHKAVKLLKEGEEAMFIFPSNAAYGYHGDEKRIGQNIPLQMKLKIIKIDHKKNNKENIKK